MGCRRNGVHSVFGAGAQVCCSDGESPPGPVADGVRAGDESSDDDEIPPLTADADTESDSDAWGPSKNGDEPSESEGGGSPRPGRDERRTR